MPFVNIKGFKGKLYIPEETDNSQKKHPCSDCYYCQFCSDERCELCLKQKCCKSNEKKEGE